MKRNEHLFQFTGADIGKAASAEAKYHRDRLAWWEREQSEAREAAKTATVTAREYDVTGGKRVEMVIDPSFSSRLTECGNKIQSHRAAAERYEIEAAAYGTQADRCYELQSDDVVYFRLGGGAREE